MAGATVKRKRGRPSAADIAARQMQQAEQGQQQGRQARGQRGRRRNAGASRQIGRQATGGAVRALTVDGGEFGGMTFGNLSLSCSTACNVRAGINDYIQYLQNWANTQSAAFGQRTMHAGQQIG